LFAHFKLKMNLKT